MKRSSLYRRATEFALGMVATRLAVLLLAVLAATVAVYAGRWGR